MRRNIVQILLHILCIFISDGDRSQEWAVKAAMWAKHRLLQEQYQQQNQEQAGPPPLPPEPSHEGQEAAPPPQPGSAPPQSGIAPPQPPPPDNGQQNTPFIHEERRRQLEEEEGIASQSRHPSSLQGTFVDSSHSQTGQAADHKRWKQFGDESENDGFQQPENYQHNMGKL